VIVGLVVKVMFEFASFFIKRRLWPRDEAPFCSGLDEVAMTYLHSQYL